MQHFSSSEDGCRFTIPGWDASNHIMDYIPSLSSGLSAKGIVPSFVIIWFKWTFPVCESTSCCHLGWKYLLPINLVNLVLMVLIIVNNWHF